MILVDASFLVKVLLEEEGSDRAREVLRKALEAGERILTVDTALPEALNALWKHRVLLKDLDEGECRSAVGELTELWSRLDVIPSSDVARDAFEIAVRDGITVYGALYLAASILRNSSLATFDEVLREKALEHGVHVLP
ncbi:type II toxin-antitoxin system VapC family toxin [Infirmifilum lucidum]|uniref:Type II toxin-antitoxin system VapC family toxin n=1 Tax=Infirmifilum lucidum TaxID=2776706 RepID=A0A7L9FHB9_9CREN|nr:type II toxin-antitoxin system VapC family toxin [Infirmifilum lucidum]QOJ79107.1 type II toxin-antitoxin system VapC family toxin [Infirmifilum lucidum]